MFVFRLKFAAKLRHSRLLLRLKLKLSKWPRKLRRGENTVKLPWSICFWKPCPRYHLIIRYLSQDVPRNQYRILLTLISHIKFRLSLKSLLHCHRLKRSPWYPPVVAKLELPNLQKKYLLL